MDVIPLVEAARELGLSPDTLRRWVRSGELTRYTRRGDRRAFVDRDQLRRLVEFRADPDTR